MGTGLDFKHFVCDSGGIFGSARDTKGKIHNFIITHSGRVMEQVSRHFEEVIGEYAELIRADFSYYYGVVPTYVRRSSSNWR
ncbi:MAG: hypothetical protein JW867_07295 [Candidatus Omnitrophica bacterium]|nr:hypothetical protein [Candidatus Omnitrophota bacterium]